MAAEKKISKAGSRAGSAGGAAGAAGGSAGAAGGSAGKSGSVAGSRGGAAGAAGGSAGKSGASSGAAGTRGGKSGVSAGQSGARGGKGGERSTKAGRTVENKGLGFVDESTKTSKSNCVRSREKENDWTIIQAIKNGIVKKDFPESVDLRADNDWWQIVNQGKTASCAAWASTDCLLRWHLVRARKIQPTNKLSVRFTWMASKETDKFVDYPETFLETSGTPLKAALNVLKKYGAVLEEHLPFEGTGVNSQMDAESFYSMASMLSINSYYSIIKEFDVNLDHLRMWLSSVGPIMVLSDTDSNFNNYNNGGKLDHYDTASVTPDSGHAFTLVGYTKDHFIIRNSWGIEWGDKGYAYASNAYISEALCEGYGIWV
ncbi:C1 family peptidase [Flavobacterium sp.]|uniref:C1 family peptidase n=1 Tax=Flavobacterium sp. TaxID=239 RepID=UPI002629E74C|nr:C1 family peptidase [Flavobacterium sp.]